MPDERTVSAARPEALHLGRLSRATPDEALNLPESGGALRTLHLSRKHTDEARGCWYVCLGGELLIDLPHGNFVHLRAQETCQLPDGVPRTLTPVREATVLVITLAPST